MGRWYSVTAAHLARLECPPELWSPALADSGATPHRDFERCVDGIKHRLPKLKRIEPDPGSGIGPMVDSTVTPSGKTAWFATRIGARAAQLPWAVRNSINPMFAAHSWMAADIGMAIESRGYNVLSERELSTGIDRHGFRVDAPLESTLTGRAGAETRKKPDLAILHPNGRDYIAIEVERDTDRSVKTYEEKLHAYRANSAVRAVWYICASDTTTKRVAAGAQKALGSVSKFPLRIHTNIASQGFHFFDMDDLHPKLLADLDPMSDDRVL